MQKTLGGRGVAELNFFSLYVSPLAYSGPYTEKCWLNPPISAGPGDPLMCMVASQLPRYWGERAQAAAFQLPNPFILG